MLVCNCTLAGSQACKSCPEYIKYFGYVYEYGRWPWQFSITYPSLNTGEFELVDKSKFDIIEKKDAKVVRLKEELNILQKSLEERSKLVDEEISRMEKIKEDVEKLNKELKELEDK